MPQHYIPAVTYTSLMILHLKEELTIIEYGNNKHHKWWKVKFPYKGQQHEPELLPCQASKSIKSSKKKMHFK